MTKTVVTPQRFAQGRTFEQYLAYIATPENLEREAFGSYYPAGGSKGTQRRDNSAVFRERYERTRLHDYQPFWAARANLLARNGDAEGARTAYQRAMGLERDPAVRAFLQARAAAL